MNWRRIIQHLLPRGIAWRAFPGSTLDRFMHGLSELPASVRESLDKLWADTQPDDTRFLSEWEEQFGLRPRALSEDDRRKRLRAQWRATGGQSRRYIQDVLREAGFDVTVYEWFYGKAERNTVQGLDRTGVLALDDGTVLQVGRVSDENPARNPEETLGGTAPEWRCGVPEARCGRTGADDREVRIISVDGGVLSIEDGALSSTGYYVVRAGSFLPPGYLLVNRGLSDPEYPDLPGTDDQERYIIYIGGYPFGERVEIPEDRRDEFEELCLQVCPAQQWLAMLVVYT